MSRYDGLIIPRSYSEYINKTDAATLSQALQLGGVLDSAPTEDSVKAIKSGGVYNALGGRTALTFDDVPTDGSDNPVKSNGIYEALAALETPVGTIIAQYKKSAPAGYLYLDGSTFSSTDYPALYAYLGSTTLPDYREFALVGAEQNNTETITTHDTYTEGQAKDDQIQNIEGTFGMRLGNASGSQFSCIPVDNSGAFSRYGLDKPIIENIGAGVVAASSVYASTLKFNASSVARAGTTTRGKRKAVYFYIKAVNVAETLAALLS